MHCGAQNGKDSYILSKGYAILLEVIDSLLSLSRAAKRKHSESHNIAQNTQIWGLFHYNPQFSGQMIYRPPICVIYGIMESILL